MNWSMRRVLQLQKTDKQQTDQSINQQHITHDNDDDDDDNHDAEDDDM